MTWRHMLLRNDDKYVLSSLKLSINKHFPEQAGGGT